MALFGEVKEVFIFADDDAVLKFGVAANGDVRGVTQACIEDVLAIESAIAEVISEGDRQLIINDKFHDVGRTTWSV
jgi:hypothetical protein